MPEPIVTPACFLRATPTMGLGLKAPISSTGSASFRRHQIRHPKSRCSYYPKQNAKFPAALAVPRLSFPHASWFQKLELKISISNLKSLSDHIWSFLILTRPESRASLQNKQKSKRPPRANTASRNAVSRPAAVPPCPIHPAAVPPCPVLLCPAGGAVPRPQTTPVPHGLPEADPSFKSRSKNTT